MTVPAHPIPPRVPRSSGLPRRLTLGLPTLGLPALCLAALYLLSAAGCNDGAPSAAHDHGGHDHGAGGHDHGAGGHDHGAPAPASDAPDATDALEPVSITLWNEALELFAEHPPAIAGAEVPFLAHLTVLPGFAALEQATVTLVLDGPAHVEARVDTMLRPGIFKPRFSAPAAGTYRAQLRVQGPGVHSTLTGFEIEVYENVKSAAFAQAKAAADAQRQATGIVPIVFLKEQQWQIPFATAFAQAGTVTPTIDVAADVSTPPGGSAAVSAGTTGRLVLPAVPVVPGQRVKKGDLLATVVPAPASPEAAATADLAVRAAEARLSSARAAKRRADDLRAQNAVSDAAVEAAAREVDVATAALDAARKARALHAGGRTARGSYRITAPIGGTVERVRTTAGQAVSPGTVLFDIVDSRALWLTARVPEQEMHGLRADANAAVRVAGGPWQPLVTQGAHAPARALHVGQRVDPRTRTVDVLYAVRPDHADAASDAGDDTTRGTAERPRATHGTDPALTDLRVGGLVRLAIPRGPAVRGVVVPRTAVVRESGRPLVYVQAEGEAFEERVVRIAAENGPHVALAAGVRAGERIVIRGANVVRLTARAPETPSHGHVH